MNRLKNVLIYGKQHLLSFLFLLITSILSAQNYADGTGTGSLQKEIFWLTWNNGLVSHPSDSDSLRMTEGQYVWQFTPSVKVIATVTNIIPITPNGDLRIYTAGNYYSDGLQKLYPGIQGQSLKDSLYASQIKFDVSVDLQLLIGSVWKSVNYPGMVVADGESLADGEYVKATTNESNVSWQLLDLRKESYTPNTSLYKVTISNNGQDFQVNLPPTYNDIFMQAVMFAKNAHSLINVETKGRGYSAVAIGIVAPFDFSDAPTSFGDAGHYLNDSIIYNNLPLLKDSVYSAIDLPQIKLSHYHKLYLGNNNTDADGTPPHSTTATIDNVTGNNDEDGFNLATQPNIQTNNATNFKLQVVASNKSNSTANVYGWIDFNGDGKFSANESAITTIPPNTLNKTLTLTFLYSKFGKIIKSGTTYARFRITTTNLIDIPFTLNLDERSIAVALDGEAEDYKLRDISIGSFIKPIGIDDADSVLVNNPLTTIVKANDSTNSITATVTITSTPLNGTTKVNQDSTVTYIPNTNYTGLDSYTYILTSTDGVVSDPINVVITVKPVGNPDSVITPPNTPVTINIKDNDSAKALNNTILINANPTNGKVVLNGNGTLTYTPDSGFIGNDTLYYTLNTVDGVSSDPIMVLIKINTVIIKKADLSINKTLLTPLPIIIGSSLSFQLTVTNNGPDSATNIVALDTLANNLTPATNINTTSGTGAFNSANNVVSWGIAGLGINKSVTLNFNTTVNGGLAVNNVAYVSGKEKDPDTTNNHQAIASVTIKPVGVNDLDSTLVNTPVTTNVKANDGNINTNDTVKIASQPTNGTVKVNTDGTVTYTPTINYTGKDTYTYTLTNVAGAISQPIIATIYVKPVGLPDRDTTLKNTPITINVKANDSAKGVNNSVLISTNPNNGTTTTNADGTITYKPNNGFVGKDTCYYILQTADGVQSSTIPVYITVLAPKSADVSIIKTLTTTGTLTIGETVSFLITVTNKGTDIATGVFATDTLANNLGAATSINTTVETAVYNANNNSINWAIGSLAVNQTVSMTFNTTINNGKTVTNTAIVVANEADPDTTNNHSSITPVPIIITIPLGVNDIDSTPVNTPITTNVKLNDGNINKNDTVKIATQPIKGTVKVNSDGTVTYTPSNGYIGKDNYNYTLTTAAGGVSAPIKVNIIVKPLGVNDIDSTEENTTITTAIKRNDGPSANNTIPVLATPPSNGSVIINPNGTATYTPKTGFIGTDTYTYTLVTQDSISSAPITVTILVKTATIKITDLSISKELLNNTALTVGSTITFSISVINNGPNDATGVVVKDTLAYNLERPTNLSTLNGFTTYDAINRIITWNIGGLAANDKATLTFNTIVDSGTMVNNAASVTGNETDPDLSNNRAAINPASVFNGSIFIPNVITPNGDGKNDKFVIVGLGAYPNSELSIFNRWDNIIYHSTNYSNDWDGSGFSTGTYYYVLKLKLPTGGTEIRKGWVLLTR